MNNENAKARSIFASAVEDYSPDQWPRFLDDACRGDGPLRQRVELLLRAHQGEDSFLDRGDENRAAATIDRTTGEGPGTVIGPYKLLQQIGEGGFGVVFLAEQERPVRRRVALKIIKSGMDTREVVARFEAERQALAMMDHPNIAKVLDAGATDRGRPYFVMELIQGVLITEYCDQCQLTTRERLELFATVCHAVQHAHQKGVIHRDIKPTNVLVAIQDGRPEPKIIDFGVAKAINQRLTEHTLMTAYAQMVGTPLYMSPEQAELSPLGVDTRSDIYSLGVLLYELLTSTTPFDRDRLHSVSYDEVRRIIREEEPPRPSARLTTLAADLATTVADHRRTDVRRLRQTIRGELDWIVMKCLEKDRSRRYETANGLARDLERYLNDEPVQACPPSAAYRLKKFIRRNKIAASFMLLLVAAVAALSVSNVQTRRSERRATTENAKAQAVSELLQGMLRSANPEEAHDADYTVRQLLDDFSASFGAGLPDQREVEAEIRATIGRAYWRLGVADKAEPHLTRALELRRGLFGRDHESIADILVDFAWCRNEQSRLPEAEDAAREALRIYRARGITGPPLFRATTVLQRVLISSGNLDEAQAVTDEALADARASGVESGELAVILHGQADLLVKRGRYSEAQIAARQSVEMHRRLHGPGHPETAWGLLALGDALQKQKKYAEAEDAIHEALTIFRQRYSGKHHSIDSTLRSLKQLLEARGDKAALDALAREEQDAAARTAESSIIDGWFKRAQLHVNLSEWREACRALEQAAAVTQSMSDSQREKLLAGYREIVDAAIAGAQLDEAVAASRKAVEMQPDNSKAHSLLAYALINNDNFDEAVVSCQKAIELEPNYANAHNSLGSALLNLQKFDQSIDACRKAIELQPNFAAPYYNIALAQFALGRHDDAVAALNKVIELEPDHALRYSELAWWLVATPELQHRDPTRTVALARRAVELEPQVGNYWNTLGAAHYRAGDWNGAVMALERSMELREGGDAFDWFFLSMALWQNDQKHDARKWYDKAATWMATNAPQEVPQWYDTSWTELQRFREEAAQLLEITDPLAKRTRRRTLPNDESQIPNDRNVVDK